MTREWKTGDVVAVLNGAVEQIALVTGSLGSRGLFVETSAGDSIPLGRIEGDTMRPLVAPPKPDEPKGLGAVVEDASGDKWVWMAQGAEGPHWHRVGLPPCQAHWRDVAAVRVLSEGVA